MKQCQLTDIEKIVLSFGCARGKRGITMEEAGELGVLIHRPENAKLRDDVIAGRCSVDLVRGVLVRKPMP